MTADLSAPRRARAILDAVGATDGVIGATDAAGSIRDVLARLAEAAEARRAFLFQVERDHEWRDSSLRYEWTSAGTAPRGDDALVQAIRRGSQLDEVQRALDAGRPQVIHEDDLAGATPPVPGGQDATVLLMPVVVEGRRVASFGLEVDARRTFEPVELAALSVAAGMVAAAIRWRRLTRAIERREDILDAVTFAAERFARGASFDEMAGDVLERLGRASGAGRAALIERRDGPDGPHMWPRAEWVASGVTALIWPAESHGYPYFPRWAAELAAGRLVAGHVRDFPDDERTLLEADGVKSIVITPVVVSGRWLGHVGYDDTRAEREWSPAEIDALRAAAGIIGAAMQQAESSATIGRRDAILGAVAAVAPHLLATRRWVEVLPELMTSLLQATGARSSWAYEVRDGQGHLVAEQVAPGELAASEFGPLIAVQPSVIERIVGGETLQNETISVDPIAERAALAKAGIRSWVLVPIVTQGRAWGVIGLDSREQRGWTEGEVVALRVAAAALRAAIEREATEDRLRQLQKMEAVGRLAGGLAHDFGNLLAVIQGHTQFLQEAAVGEEAVGDAQAVLDASKRGVDLVRDLLTFSRRRIGEVQPVDLNARIRSVQRMLGRAVGTEVEIEFRPDPQIPPVNADPGALDDVVVNLVVNARDAMPSGGRITIETSRIDGPDGPLVGLNVADTGTGMDEATRAQVFEPFFTTKAEGHGTGLGLATAYGSVTGWGGSIEVESTLGAGSTFRILLRPAGPIASA